MARRHDGVVDVVLERWRMCPLPLDTRMDR
jgi:hypothetical protein